MDKILNFILNNFEWGSFPKIRISDIVEIAIISVVIYYIIKWVKNTRAWMLFRGILVLLVFMGIATIFRFDTIIWIFSNTISVGIIAIIVVFQPELRRALEQLGQKNTLATIFSFDDQKEKNERFTDRTITEIVKATFELAKTKTGALIVIEQEVVLGEYEKTGIALDSKISSQLLINIFEHNTPLHDGAIIIRGNRIVAATCYLPLSENMMINKELGTRHRAGIGISEVSDSLTIIVSEETGKVSLAIGGELIRNVDGDNVRNKLSYIQKRSIDVKKFKLWKGRSKYEGKAVK